MRDDMLYRVAQLVVLLLVVNLFVIGYVFWTGYQGRKDVVKSQRAGCERGKLDRSVNARGWRIAEGARRAEGQYKVASHYNDIASSLEKRSRIVCSEAFPKARLIP